MNSQITSLVSVWGPFLGTASFAWNIWTWLANRPKIAAKFQAYEASLEEGGISLEIRNRGRQPTTVEEIHLVTYFPVFFGGILARFGLYESCEFVSAKYKETAKLPIYLQPNEVWKGTVPFQTNTFPDRGNLELIQEGRLYYRIRCAHSDGFLCGKVKREDLGLLLK